MSTDIEYGDTGHARFEQRLRRELEHLTVQVPADIIPRAHRRYRRRLITTRVTAISGTAAMIAGAATIVAMAGPSLGLSHGSQRPGTVAGQAPAAKVPPVTLKPPAPGDGLSGQQAAREISWTRATSTSASGVTSVSDTFSYSGTTRVIGFSQQGTVLYDQQTSVVTGSAGTPVLASTNVNYPGGWVARGTAPAPDRAAQPVECPMVREAGLASLLSASVLVASGASLLDCPGVTVTRGVRIDGLNAVTISSNVMDVRTTVWLNGATSLPVAATTISRGVTKTILFGFLPPTAANLGYLSAYVPPGFKPPRSPGAR